MMLSWQKTPSDINLWPFEAWKEKMSLPRPGERFQGEARRERRTLSPWTPGSFGFPSRGEKKKQEWLFKSYILQGMCMRQSFGKTYIILSLCWIRMSLCRSVYVFDAGLNVDLCVCVCVCVLCTLRMMSGLEASAGRDNTSPLMVWVWSRYLR